MKKITFVIWTPRYTEKSAGVRALYLLKYKLAEKGCTVFTADEAKDLDLTHEDTVVVYPEIVTGNPLNAKNVARWCLNRPGLLGGEPVYDESEHVFYYSSMLVPHIHNKIAGKLYMPTLRKDIFFDDGKNKRYGFCYYVGKGKYLDGIINANDGKLITRFNPSSKEVGEIFRRSEVFYCFDTFTAMTHEAVACGCPAILIPDGAYEREFYKNSELGLNGVGFGLGELQWAQDTIQLFPGVYAKVEQEADEQLEAFIKYWKGVIYK